MNIEEKYAEQMKQVMDLCIAARASNSSVAHPEIDGAPTDKFAYRDMPWKQTPLVCWDKGCPRCESKEHLRHGDITAGCRMNGDGYGSNFTYCTNCGLFDYFSWDQS